MNSWFGPCDDYVIANRHGVAVLEAIGSVCLPYIADQPSIPSNCNDFDFFSVHLQFDHTRKNDHTFFMHRDHQLLNRVQYTYIISQAS